MKSRLDQELVNRQLVPTRSQAESYIKLGKVRVDTIIVSKPGYQVGKQSTIELTTNEQYVSRAALKLASVADSLGLNFKYKVVLDVGSSTGGFTDYALKHGAEKVIAVEVGTNQMHPSLRQNSKIELHEQTDIRDIEQLSQIPDIVVADVSFISLRDILPHLSKLVDKHTQLVMMVKPQFEADKSSLKHKGVIKNDQMRRQILKDFEVWVKDNNLMVIDKADSEVSGAKGNRERFYLLKVLA